MNAILIDSEHKELRYIDINGIEEIQKAIGCSCFALGGILGKLTMYVDDEGLWKNPRYFFKWPGHSQELAGNGLLVSVDSEGTDIDVQITIDDLKEMVTFLEVQGWKLLN